MGNKKQPVAVCTDCITYSFVKEDIDTQCRVQRKERRCGGILVDATDPINWKSCSACSGNGEVMGETCVACQASGWLLTRRR